MLATIQMLDDYLTGDHGVDNGLLPDYDDGIAGMLTDDDDYGVASMLP